MKLSELDKNSKYGYRRKGWSLVQDYVYYNWIQKVWYYSSSSGHSRALKATKNIEADDWYLSDIRVTQKTRPIFKLKGLQ